MKDLNQEELENIQKLRNLSGEPEDRIHRVLEALMKLVIQNYSEGERIAIPYFGNLKIKYNGDKITPKGKEAQIDLFFSPSDYIKYNVGKIEDFKKKQTKFNDIDIIKDTILSLVPTLKQKLSDSYEDVEKGK